MSYCVVCFFLASEDVDISFTCTLFRYVLYIQCTLVYLH